MAAAAAAAAVPALSTASVAKEHGFFEETMQVFEINPGGKTYMSVTRVHFKGVKGSDETTTECRLKADIHTEVFKLKLGDRLKVTLVDASHLKAQELVEKNNTYVARGTMVSCKTQTQTTESKTANASESKSEPRLCLLGSCSGLLVHLEGPPTNAALQTFEAPSKFYLLIENVC